MTSTRPSPLSSTSPGTKIHPYHISARRFYTTTLAIMLNGIHLTPQGGDHAEHAVPENQESIIYFILSSQNFFLCSFEVPMTPSHAITKDPYPQLFSSINSYFYVIFQYSTYSQIWGSVGYPNQDSILVYHEIPLIKSQIRLLG